MGSLNDWAGVDKSGNWWSFNQDGELEGIFKGFSIEEGEYGDTPVYRFEDREGEAIAWHLTKALDLTKIKKVERIVFHEITKGAISDALKNPREIDMHLVDAQQARRILDRLVGYKLSPFLWKKIARGLSAGRVQSVAVRLIVSREREIEAFKPIEYWEIEAEPGKTTRGTFIAPEKTGIYNVVCGKKDHIEKGMLGQVVVT